MSAQNVEPNPVLADLREPDRQVFDQSGLRAGEVRQAVSDHAGLICSAHNE